ncbi:methionine adenosyltransferase [Candidatus Kryptobacter tengchongensis]|uniref:S-adenosylmethionine synthase n=1 Tax=Kryptobacter tengchongensis TaxID=1643429 RepID=A0A656D9K3_KRYT1|nr:methionine adenosyltransferase [Candidatus Kryptobacter tengchongensis]CUT02523.1 methionine adenosyltransferase [Candidatus Kryptobacter tengchongensis]
MGMLFTSESVAEGHPDKICDQISDAVLDAFLTYYPEARVACEVFVTTGLVVIGGEIKAPEDVRAKVDFDQLARDVIKDIGYDKSEYQFDYRSCGVIVTVKSQSPDIAKGVDKGGAGDQGMMFGYACRETPELMPMPIMFAHKLMKRLAYVRKKTDFMPYLRPDGKCQVTIEYDDTGKPVRVDTIVFSVQHDERYKGKKLTSKDIAEDLKEFVIKEVIPEEYLDKKTKYYINPTGSFVIGGPHGDTGLTGRKIIVDTYGGRAPHGGGCFSGKDPTKVDRSAAYEMRHIAKNIVASGLADECLIQVAYAIGVSKPVAIYVDTKGTGKVPDNLIADFIMKNLDLSPLGIIDRLKLRRPIYRKTAVYGHFGRNEPEFTWEKLDYVPMFKELLK